MAITIDNNARVLVDGANNGHLLDYHLAHMSQHAEIKAAFDAYLLDVFESVVALGGLPAGRDAAKAAYIAALEEKAADIAEAIAEAQSQEKL